MSYWKEEIKPKLKSYIITTKGGYSKVWKDLGIPQKSFNHLVYGNTIPRYDRGKLIELYLEENYKDGEILSEEEIRKNRKGKTEIKPETYYQQLKREGKLKI